MKKSILAGILLISLAACSGGSGGWDWSWANPMTWFGGDDDDIVEPSPDDVADAG
ncbi:MAG: hypothetical protein OXI81_12920 [Paracoccaceae bacterium]|nr:hypothetical protein [Paracoccaceae bacterium]MDE2911802.1 hypothetical protein [Paracoccaceae bacterium]